MTVVAAVGKEILKCRSDCKEIAFHVKADERTGGRTGRLEMGGSRLYRMLFTGSRDDDLGGRQAPLDFLTEPLDSTIITVDQKCFFGADFFDVVGDCVAG